MCAIEILLITQQYRDWLAAYVQGLRSLVSNKQSKIPSASQIYVGLEATSGVFNILEVFPGEAEPLHRDLSFNGELPPEAASGSGQQEEYRTITFHVGGQPLQHDTSCFQHLRCKLCRAMLSTFTLLCSVYLTMLCPTDLPNSCIPPHTSPIDESHP